jgi:hypothetical protein
MTMALLVYLQTLPGYDVPVLLYINKGRIDDKIGDTISSMRMKSNGSFSLEPFEPGSNPDLDSALVQKKYFMMSILRCSDFEFFSHFSRC